MKAIRVWMLLVIVGWSWSCSSLFNSNPGKAYITSADDKISVVSLADNKVVGSIDVGEMPRGIASSRDGKRVYVANMNSDTVSVVDTQKSEVIATFEAHHTPVACAVGPDDRRLYVACGGGISGNDGNAVYGLDPQTGKVIWKNTEILGPTGLTVTPDGKTLFVTSHMEHSLYAIDGATGKILKDLKHIPMTDGVVVSPDGKRVYVASHIYGGFVRAYDTSNYEQIAQIRVGEGPKGLDISPDGHLLCVANQGTRFSAKTVMFVSTDTNKVLKTVQVGDGPVQVNFTPDGSKVYVTCEYVNLMRVIDVNKMAVVATIQVGKRPYSFGRFISARVSSKS